MRPRLTGLVVAAPVGAVALVLAGGATAGPAPPAPEHPKGSVGRLVVRERA